MAQGLRGKCRNTSHTQGPKAMFLLAEYSHGTGVVILNDPSILVPP